MTDPQNHLDLARDALVTASDSYADTALDGAVIEQALIGIGHALLALHDRLHEGVHFDVANINATITASGGMLDDPQAEHLWRLLYPPKAQAAEPPADISGIPMEQP